MLALSAAQAAPDLLRKRFFGVSWTESRTSREVGRTEFRNIAAAMQVTVYLSSAGRLLI
jgi:hypothetical protein